MRSMRDGGARRGEEVYVKGGGKGNRNGDGRCDDEPRERCWDGRERPRGSFKGKERERRESREGKGRPDREPYSWEPRPREGKGREWDRWDREHSWEPRREVKRAREWEREPHRERVSSAKREWEREPYSWESQSKRGVGGKVRPSPRRIWDEWCDSVDFDWKWSKGSKDVPRDEMPTGKIEDLMVTDKAPIHFEVDKWMAGIIIGKNGHQVKEIQSRTGAFLESAKKKDSDKRFIKIYGSAKAHALDMICELFSPGRHAMHSDVTDIPCLSFVIDDNVKESLLAKHGAVLKKIKRESRVKEVHVEETVVLVRASAWRDIAHAGMLLNDITKSVGKTDGSANDFRAQALVDAPPPGRIGKFKRRKSDEPIRPFKIPKMGVTVPIQLLVDKKMCGPIIGKAGATITDITESTGAVIEIKDEPRNMGERTCTIKGEENEKLPALSTILEKLDEAQDGMKDAYFVVPEDYVSTVLGSKGTNIQSIQRESDTKIVISRTDRGEIAGGVHVKGTRQAIFEAASMIDATVNHRHLELLEEYGLREAPSAD